LNLICGINPVLEALVAGTRHFDRLLVVKGIRNTRVSEAISRATQLAIPLRFEPRETLDRIAAGLPHQGIVAVVSAKPVIDIHTLLEPDRENGLMVVLDGVEDPRNLGAIIRTAEAAGADGVVLPERHSVGLSETVSRASAGAIEHVKVARVGNVVQALETLKAKGYWVVGFDAAGRERWDQVDYKRKIALVLGGEGRGMRRLVREHCDHLVALPLFGHVGSLNVSVAAGIALYEVVRQRGVVPSLVRPIPVRSAGTPVRIVGPSAEDGESDPGAIALDHEDDDPGPETDGLETDDEALRLLNLHEEAAWAGPTVLKPIDFRRRHGGPRRDHRRPGPPGPHGGPRRAPSGDNGPGSAAGPRDEGRGERNDRNDRNDRGGDPRGERRGRGKRRRRGQGRRGDAPRPLDASRPRSDGGNPHGGGSREPSARAEGDGRTDGAPPPFVSEGGGSETRPPASSVPGAPEENKQRSGRRRRRRRRH
jgi:23S rRNA (guanosine2251-2'-O)-methyltransferase